MAWINKIQNFLERIDGYRDKALFIFIKPYWPDKIVPNYITYIRIVVGILIFVLLFFLNIDNKFIIIWLFIIGAITDFIDGPVARGKNQVTEFGAMLDSTADRILVLPIAFYALYKFHKWLLLALIITELINAIFSIFYKSKEIYLESNIFGKTKMVIICVSLAVILALWPKPSSVWVMALLLCTIPLSFLSIFSKLLDLKSNGKIKFKNL